MEDKKEKAQILADKLNNILPLIDGFMNSLNDEDFNHIHDNLKWQVNRLLKHIESDE